MSDETAKSWSARIEAVYNSQSRELWALFYAQCSNADRAYDAVQEAFVRLQAQKDADIRDMRAWLLRVGRNWLRDVARRQKVAATSADYLDAMAGEQTEASSELQKEELHEQVREALSGVAEADREVLVLRYALGWSSNRIADVLNTTASAVDMRLSRARRRLATQLKESEVDYE